MKRIIKTLFFISLVLNSTLISAQNKWVAPSSADSIEISVDNKQQAIKEGRILFQQLCAICHGDKGRGDGLASAALNPKPANFQKGEFQNQSKGAIYWKITEGRPPMASYKEALSDEQRWQIVEYLKTFKKQ